MLLVPYIAAWTCDKGYAKDGQPLGINFRCREVYYHDSEWFVRNNLKFEPCPTFLNYYDPRCASSEAAQAYLEWGYTDTNCPYYSPKELSELFNGLDFTDVAKNFQNEYKSRKMHTL